MKFIWFVGEDAYKFFKILKTVVMNKSKSISNLIVIVLLITVPHLIFAQTINPEVEALFFKNSKFSEQIWIEIPKESDYQAYLNIKQNPVIYETGMPKARITIGNTLKSYDQSMLSYFVHAGYAEIIKLVQIRKSSYGDTSNEYYFIFYKDDFKNIITYDGEKAYVSFGKRELGDITYVNEYEDAPMGMKRTFYAIVFNYKIVTNPILKYFPKVISVHEGRAKAFKDPDDGRWKLNNIFEGMGVKLSDRGRNEYFEILKNSYSPYNYDVSIQNKANDEPPKVDENYEKVDSNFTGFLKHLNEKGDLYEGEFKFGKRDGKGKIVYHNGAKYDGDWKEDKKHGFGKHINKDGSYYEGEWKLNKMDGKGVTVDQIGQKYDGYFIANEREGVGISYGKNAEFSDTLNYKNGKLFGHNIKRYEDEAGNFYRIEGVYDEKGNKNGPGSYLLKRKEGDISIFEGEFLEDKEYNGVYTAIFASKPGFQWRIEYKNGKEGKMKKIKI